MIHPARLTRLLAPVALLTAAAYVLLVPQTPSTDAAPAHKYLSPLDVALTDDASTLYVTLHTGDAVAVLDVASGKVKATIPVPKAPAGLALSPDQKTLYVVQSEANAVAVIDTASTKVVKSIPVGWLPWGVTATADRLYVCNRFSNDISVVDVKQGKEVKRIAATREPYYAAVANGKLLAGNGLPAGSAMDHTMAAAVTFASADGRGEAKQLRLSPGCNAVRQVVTSSDGKWAYLVHLLSRFNVPTTQLDRGWMNTNALTVFDLEKGEVWVTILLDEIMRGYANPHGVALSKDGAQLFITHAGSDDLTVIDVKRLHEYVGEQSDEDRLNLQNRLSTVHGKDVGDHMNVGGRGPHGVAVVQRDGQQFAYVANYYSDDVTVVDVKRRRAVQTIALGPKVELDEVRKGEMLFHDATICFQQWQSCASCHPDTRADGFNWDLLNDGIGNPKNAKSLILSARTPPAMSTGIRGSMEVAAVAGIRYILFREPEPGEAEAIQAYLRSLEPHPSPYLINGKLSPAAERGQKLFNDPQVGCATCHPAPLYTDLRLYDVGTQGPYDREQHEFDTPTLVELYRSGPYLHTGAAATLKEIITLNKGDEHGKTSHLKPQQVDDLVAFMQSL